MITAERNITSVRAAMKLGAVGYLVIGAEPRPPAPGLLRTAQDALSAAAAELTGVSRATAQR
ncbi:MULTISPECIES: hypothetical protein [unclassified Streptomyces]|uniref:hypothetical protein n=1 Tax=Streptomyces TaxID=1883 RepID=UPI0004BDE788|nr:MULTISPECIES: hypothetical protein [unclassified Streptomyces]